MFTPFTVELRDTAIRTRRKRPNCDCKAICVGSDVASRELPPFLAQAFSRGGGELAGPAGRQRSWHSAGTGARGLSCGKAVDRHSLYAVTARQRCCGRA